MSSLEWHFGIVFDGSAKLRYITPCVSVRVSPGAFLIHIQTSYIIIMKLYLCLYWNKGDDFFFPFHLSTMRIVSHATRERIVFLSPCCFFVFKALFHFGIVIVRYSHSYGLVSVPSQVDSLSGNQRYTSTISECENSMRESALLTQCCWSMVSDGKTLVWQFNCTSTCSLLAIVAAVTFSPPRSTLDSFFFRTPFSLFHPPTNVSMCMEMWMCVCDYEFMPFPSMSLLKAITIVQAALIITVTFVAVHHSSPKKAQERRECLLCIEIIQYTHTHQNSWFYRLKTTQKLGMSMTTTKKEKKMRWRQRRRTFFTLVLHNSIIFVIWKIQFD